MPLTFDQAVEYAQRVSKMLNFKEVLLDPVYIDVDTPGFYIDQDFAVYFKDGVWHVDGTTYFGGSFNEPPSADCNEDVFVDPDPIKAIHWVAMCDLREALDNLSIDYGTYLEDQQEKANPAPADFLC